MKKNFHNFVFKYAFRSLLRHKRRSAITIFTITLCLAISIIASRYSVSIMDLWKDGAADTGTAHFQFHAEGYQNRSEGIDQELTILEGNDFEQSLREDPDVEAVSRRLRFEGLIKTEEASYYFIAIATNSTEEIAVSPRLFWPGHDEGSFLKNDKRESAVIAKGLGNLLDIELGGEATLVAQTVHGSVNAVDIEIDGFVNIPLPGFSNRVVYMNLEQAQRLLRLPNSYNELAIRLKPDVNHNVWYEKNKKIATQAGGELNGWWTVDPLISKAEKIWNRVARLLCFLLFLSASLTVLNVIFMIVNERVVEIGTLKAIGAKDKDVKILISAEAAMIGIIGGSIGIIIGNIVVFIMGSIGVPFQSPFGGGVEIAYPSIDYVWSLLFFIGTIIGCGLCAVLPSRKATKLQPVEAFRNAA